MSEILPIFHHSPPPPYHQVPPYIQRGMGNADSQCNRFVDSGFPSPGIFDATEKVQCSGFLKSSSVDELSKVTAIVGHTRSLKKRKLEFDDVDVGLHEPSNAKKDTEMPDYIHVRARRGQATDRHSLAERARREKIKKKMQLLQDMVPGCNKITNKAAILDEIIYYVQSLQMEVEFLTMQLAASTLLQDGQLIG